MYLGMRDAERVAKIKDSVWSQVGYNVVRILLMNGSMRLLDMNQLAVIGKNNEGTACFGFYDHDKVQELKNLKKISSAECLAYAPAWSTILSMLDFTNVEQPGHLLGYITAQQFSHAYDSIKDIYIDPTQWQSLGMFTSDYSCSFLAEEQIIYLWGFRENATLSSFKSHVEMLTKVSKSYLEQTSLGYWKYLASRTCIFSDSHGIVPEIVKIVSRFNKTYTQAILSKKCCSNLANPFILEDIPELRLKELEGMCGITLVSSFPESKLGQLGVATCKQINITHIRGFDAKVFEQKVTTECWNSIPEHVRERFSA